MKHSILVALALVGLASVSARADDDPKMDRQVDELRARQRWLEQRLAADEAKLAADDAKPRFRFGNGGFVFTSADGKSEIRFRAVLHVDERIYMGDTTPMPDTFIIRRARPFVEGTLWGVFDFRLMPNFAYGQATIDDAYIEVHPFNWLRLRAGRWRVPIGLEWIQSDCAIHLVERSLATDLVPWRDLGVELWGQFADATIEYELGVFNGAPDYANGPDFDNTSDKDYVGRIFVRPLQRTRLASWANLGFGFAGSYGNAHGTIASTQLPTYKSPGQYPIFSYATSTTTPDAAALADGARWRVTPQAYLYAGPIGFLAEYVVSSQRVSRLGEWADVQNRAWNLTAVFVLTMERASFDGVKPRRPVDFRHFALGAWEVVLRYSELRIDNDAFPLFADPTLSVHGARELAAGLNWYVTDFVKVMASFHRTDFTGGAVMGDREAENALLLRLQIAL